MLRIRQDLPAWGVYNKILDLILNNQVVVICGETGCGKSTQVGTWSSKNLCTLSNFHRLTWRTCKHIGLRSAHTVRLNVGRFIICLLHFQSTVCAVPKSSHTVVDLVVHLATRRWSRFKSHRGKKIFGSIFKCRDSFKPCENKLRSCCDMSNEQCDSLMRKTNLIVLEMPTYL